MQGLAEALKARKDQGLNQVETVVRTLPNASLKSSLVDRYKEEEGLDDDQLLAARVKFFATNLDVVDERLGTHVLPSASLKLTLAEIKTLIDSWGRDDVHAQQLLPRVAAWVQQTQAKFGCDSVMIKLGSRSAKDITWRHKKTLDVQKLDRFQNAALYDRLAMLYRAQIDCLKVQSWQEALELLLSSSRVLFDLELDILVPEDLNTCIIIRPWESLPLSSEYRGFCFNGRLCAISQYFTDLYFGDDINADLVTSEIEEFFDANLKGNVEPNCIIDFVAGAGLKTRVLEINQWATTTGSGLFDWQEDIKECTSLPISFRRVQSHRPLTQLQLPKEWIELINKEY